MKRLLPVALLLSALLAVGCSREAEDWRSAQAADTPESYAAFLRQHADSAQAATATLRMEQLAEERDWQLASSEDSSQAYQTFLAQHPQGKWSQEARIRVENFTLNQSIGPAPGESAEPLPPAPQSQPVGPPPVVAPAAANVAGGNFGVQLGAFSSEARAQAEWQALSSRYRSELGGQPHRVAAGKSGGAPVYRLQVARASERQARDLCARLNAKGQGCTVVLP